MGDKKAIAAIGVLGWVNHKVPDDRGKYNACANLFNVEQQKIVEAALQAVAQSEHKLDLSEVHSPINPIDKRKADGSFSYPEALREGACVINASTQFQPKTFWTRSRVECDPDEIRGGDKVMLELTPYAWTYGGRKGVGLGLDSIWLIKKGDVVIGGGARAGEAFKSVDVSDLDFDDELDT